MILFFIPYLILPSLFVCFSSLQPYCSLSLLLLLSLQHTPNWGVVGFFPYSDCFGAQGRMEGWQTWSGEGHIATIQEAHTLCGTLKCPLEEWQKEQTVLMAPLLPHKNASISFHRKGTYPGKALTILLLSCLLMLTVDSFMTTCVISGKYEKLFHSSWILVFNSSFLFLPSNFFLFSLCFSLSVCWICKQGVQIINIGFLVMEVEVCTRSSAALSSSQPFKKITHIFSLSLLVSPTFSL